MAAAAPSRPPATEPYYRSAGGWGGSAPRTPIGPGAAGAGATRRLELRLAEPDANQRPSSLALSNRWNARRRRSERPLPEGGTAPEGAGGDWRRPSLIDSAPSVTCAGAVVITW